MMVCGVSRVIVCLILDFVLVSIVWLGCEGERVPQKSHSTNKWFRVMLLRDCNFQPKIISEEWPKKPIGNCLKTCRQCVNICLHGCRFIWLNIYITTRLWMRAMVLIFAHKKKGFFFSLRATLIRSFGRIIFGIDFSSNKKEMKIILNKMSIESCDFRFIFILFKNNALRRDFDWTGIEWKFQWKMANGMFTTHFFFVGSSLNLGHICIIKYVKLIDSCSKNMRAWWTHRRQEEKKIVFIDEMCMQKV